MPDFPAQRLAEWTGGRWTALPVSSLTGFNTDTRKLRTGDVFVALKTEKRDGHDFLAAALAAGATAALVAQANPAIALPQLVVKDPLAAFQSIAREHRRRFRGPVIGISGSAGKTSTKDLLALLLGGAASGVDATEDSFAPDGEMDTARFNGRVLATEGNLNNFIGVPLTLTRIDPARHAFAVVEAGISEPGEMKVLAEMIEPDISIVTLVAPAHTEVLGGIEGVACEKAMLCAATRAGGLALFPASTVNFEAFRSLSVPAVVVSRADVVRPSEPAKNQAHFAVSHRANQTGISIADGAKSPLTFVCRRVSDGMAQNAALAICAALRLGIPPPLIKARLVSWKPAKLRGEIRDVDGRLFYVDCYNANPASMADALATFAAIAPAGVPRLYVLGGMEELGASAAAHHRELGRSLRLRPDDRVVVIGTHAHEVSAGLLEQGDFARQMETATSLAAIASVVSGWPGAVFVKGSRRYQLEKVLAPAAALPAST